MEEGTVGIWGPKETRILFACCVGEEGGKGRGEFREFEEETVDGMANIAMKLLLRILSRWSG